MKRFVFLSILLVLSCNETEDVQKSVEPLYSYDVEERLEELNITIL